jgi:hypothetical protein
MNRYRSATLALAAGAATLAVAACSSGTPSVSSASSSTPASSSSTGTAVPVVSAPVPTTGAPIQGSTITLKGKLGSFPIPAAAKVGENISGGSSLLLIFGSITPPDVARFYATALPQAGFTVTRNALVSQGGQHGAIVQFTGKGYKGSIESVDQFPGASIAGIGATNVTTVEVSQST